MTFTQSHMTDSTYNGWTNYETWNAALWLGNDEGLYNIAKDFEFYSDLLPTLKEICGIRTPDGVRWEDASINSDEMDEMLSELS